MNSRISTLIDGAFLLIVSVMLIHSIITWDVAYILFDGLLFAVVCLLIYSQYIYTSPVEKVDGWSVTDDE